jgi:hypothetical protein
VPCGGHRQRVLDRKTCAPSPAGWAAALISAQRPRKSPKMALDTGKAVQIKKVGWLFVFVIVAIVPNPNIPPHLKRETWAFVDIAAAVLLLLSIAVIDFFKPRT